MIDIYRFDSGVDGHHLLIFGAIHGNEVAGPIVLKPLIEKLEKGELRLKSGRLTIVPICNPRAHDADVRFTETNLNRTIKQIDNPQTYEEELAQHLIPLIDECDYLLDIHSTHIEGDPAFTFMDERSESSMNFAKSIGWGTLAIGWENVYEGEDYATEAYANSLGKAALTVECGYHKSDDAIYIAQTVTDNALSFLNILNIETERMTQQIIYRFDKKYMYQTGDQLTKIWRHLEFVEKGQTLYKNANGEAITAPYDGNVLMPNPDADEGMELFYFGYRAE